MAAADGTRARLERDEALRSLLAMTKLKENGAASASEVLAARQLTDVRPMEGGETLFGEDLISEKSLDEVILAYLAGETDNK